MGIFKKTTNINGKFKYMTASSGKFINPETGEEIEVASMIEQAMGDQPFDLAVSAKDEEDID
jgi:hypothetical protein